MQKAIAAVTRAPYGYRIAFSEPKRSTEQNDKLWAMLGEVSKQITYHGLKLSPEDWKQIFMLALDKETRVVPNLAGDGFVTLGTSSSSLGVKDMMDLITLIEVEGLQRGVVFKDQK